MDQAGQHERSAGEPAPSGAPPGPASFVAPQDTARAGEWVAPETVVGGGETPLVRTELGGADLRATVADLAVETTGVAPRVPVPLVPLRHADLLDGAWAVVKARPRAVYALTALIVLPFDIAAFFIMGDPRIYHVWWQVLSATVPLSDTATSTSYALRGPIAAALLVIPATFLGAALTLLALPWYDGRDLPVREVLRQLGRRLPALLGVLALSGGLGLAAAFLCFLAGLPSLFAVTLTTVAVPALVAEGIGPARAIGRSFSLVRRRLAACMWITCLTVLIELIVFLALITLPATIGAFVDVEAVGEVLFPLGSVLAQLVIAPFAPAVSLMIYLDLRVRTEGMDIDREATSAFAGVG